MREWEEYDVSDGKHLRSCDGCGLLYCYGCGDFKYDGYEYICSNCHENEKRKGVMDKAVADYKSGNLSSDEAMKIIVDNYK